MKIWDSVYIFATYSYLSYRRIGQFFLSSESYSKYSAKLNFYLCWSDRRALLWLQKRTPPCLSMLARSTKSEYFSPERRSSCSSRNSVGPNTASASSKVPSPHFGFLSRSNWNGLLRHALGGAVIFISLPHFISPSLYIMLCLSLCLVFYYLLALPT